MILFVTSLIKQLLYTNQFSDPIRIRKRVSFSDPNPAKYISDPRINPDSKHWKILHFENAPVLDIWNSIEVGFFIS